MDALRTYWQNWWWRAGVVFLAAFAWFLVFQLHGGVADPDAFYHIKISQLLIEQGLVRDFWWLSKLSIFSYAYADQHVLYHALLAPFVVWGHPIAGAKLSQAVFSSVAIVVAYEFLRSQAVRRPGMWVILFATAAPWVFRASLIKAPVVSFALLLIGIWCLIRDKRRALGVVSFLYVWTYGGFIVLFAVAVAWFVLSWVDVPLARYREISLVRRWWEVSGRKSYRSLEGVIFGMGLGFVLHPYAPQHIAYLWTQFVDIGMLNAQNVISVGGEWYRYAPGELFTQNFFVAVAWLSSVIVFGLTLRAQSRASWLLLIVSFVWVLMTLKSRRYIEYSVPFAVISAAFSYRDAHRVIGADVERLLQSLKERYAVETRMVGGLLGLMFVLFVSLTGIQNWENLADGYPYEDYRDAMTWTREHLPEGATIFHDDWDVFPVLWYYDDRHQYLTGLDPTFSYLYDPARYQTWVNMTTGRDVQDLNDRIQEEFGAEYAVIDQDHGSVAAALNRSGAHVIYEDARVQVFELQ